MMETDSIHAASHCYYNNNGIRTEYQGVFVWFPGNVTNRFQKGKTTQCFDTTVAARLIPTRLSLDVPHMRTCHLQTLLKCND